MYFTKSRVLNLVLKFQKLKLIIMKKIINELGSRGRRPSNLLILLFLFISVIKTYADDLYGRSGGGAFVCSNAILSACIIRDCNAEVDGGGAVCFSGSRIQNCLFFDNEAAGKGGGVYSYNGGNVYNCTISSNSADNGGGIFRESEKEGNIFNSIIYFNNANISENNYHTTSNIEYSCANPLPVGEGNKDVDPEFLGNNPLPPFIKGEFRLKAISPCINMGYNNYAPTFYDLDNNIRIFIG